MHWRRSRTAVVVCLLAALTLIVADIRGSALGGWLRATVATVAGPAEQALNRGSAPVRGLAAGAGGQTGAGAAELAAANQQLREQLAAAARGALDASAAAELAALAPPAGYRQAAAHVVAVAAPTDLVATVTIDAGTDAGVALGAAVISADGVVGVVDSVARTTATVRLVTDAAGAIPARVARTKEVGIFRGSGQADTGSLELLDPLGQMHPKDLVVTLGSADGQPFPKGLPIGRITEVTGSATALDRRAVVRTLVDASTLDSVAVLVAEPQAAADATGAKPQAGATGQAGAR